MLEFAISGTRPVMSQSRNKQLAWLDEAVAKTGLTLNALAELARIHPATLYRFTKGESDHMRPVTINRIAKAARIEPPEFSGLSDSDAREYALDSLPNTKPPGAENPNLVAVKVLNDAMSLRDISPGDLLIIDKERNPNAGDIVCAQVYDFRLGDAETIIRFYEPPYLVAASEDAAFRRPLLIDNEKVQITGVVVKQIRVREFNRVA